MGEDKLATIVFKLDILSAAQKEAKFLQKIEKCHFELYEEKIVRNAIRRYETIWLPLQAKFGDVTLEPPLDVYWIWHTHMLAPISYQMDCNKIAGKIVDHKFGEVAALGVSCVRSQEIWQKFCSDSEPFDYGISLSTLTVDDYQQKSTYDIAAAIRRQRSFNYHVSLPHYTSQKFLAESVERYRRFIWLNRKFKNDSFVPCYDFDLVWHSHLVHPIAYTTDTTRILGGVLDHIDYIDDRTNGSQLVQEEGKTKSCWEKNFPENQFFRRGSMYRGHSAPALCGLQMAIRQLSEYNVLIENVKAIGFVKCSSLNLRLRLDGKLINDVKMLQSVTGDGTYEYRWPSGMAISLDKERERKLVFKPKFDDSTHCELMGKINCSNLVTGESDEFINVIQMFLRNTKQSSAASIELTARRVARKLVVVEKRFKRKVITEGSSLYDICYGAALSKPTYGQAFDVFMASHNVTDDRFWPCLRKLKYSITVIQAGQNLLSLILVYDAKSRLLVMSHLVGPDTLPPKEYIEPRSNMLDLSAPDERAMIIVNYKGDFAMVKGKWNERRTPTTRGKKGQAGSAGYLELDLFNLGPCPSFMKKTLPDSNNKMTLNFGNTYSNENGDITTTSDNAPEDITAIMSLMNIFNLCNPDKVRLHDSHRISGHKPFQWRLARACGYGAPNIVMPSNRYFVQQSQMYRSVPGYGSAMNWFMYGDWPNVDLTKISISTHEKL